MEQDLLEHILDVSRHMAEARDLTLLLNYAVDEAIKLVGAERCYVVLVRSDGSLDFRVQRGQHAEELENGQDQVSRSILRQVVETSQPLVLRDAMQDPRFREAESVVILELRSIMCVPLVSRGNTIGAIYAENRSIRGRFSKDAAAPLVLFANQAAVAIENACLFEALQQAHDELEVRVEERTLELSKANARLEREIAERKRAEQESRQAREAAEKAQRAAEAASRAKSIFLTNMSHELRTPLNAILGFSELMARDSNLTRKQQENLATIGRSGEHLLTLINDVLELSKIEAGRVELQPEAFDLHHMLLNLEEMFRLRAEQKGLALVFERSPSVPQYVRVDRGKLRQALINLLGNAVKFTHEGSIVLRVAQIGESANRRISKSANQQISELQTCRLAFEVEDTGVGIAPDELDKAFDAFVQTSSGRQSKRGTGLGLPISHQYVQMMGGNMSVRSEPAEGSCFQFDVPVEVVDAAELEMAQPTHRAIGLEPGQQAADGGPYRLLVVEDVEADRTLLVGLLRSLGFQVREATNGQQAIEIWEEWSPHLVFMDVRMPVLGGHEATRRIKATLQGQETVIVALTASAFEEDRAAALTAGCDDFVRKPFREADILDVLARYLSVRFVYEEPERGDREGGGALTLVGMDSEWLADLHRATLQGDSEWIERLIGQIQAQNPALAGELAALAHNFEHQEILRLIAGAIRD
jgi:signal transduction histidine kinase/CheY-like chemotaxis protein